MTKTRITCSRLLISKISRRKIVTRRRLKIRMTWSRTHPSLFPKTKWSLPPGSRQAYSNCVSPTCLRYTRDWFLPFSFPKVIWRLTEKAKGGRKIFITWLLGENSVVCSCSYFLLLRNFQMQRDYCRAQAFLENAEIRKSNTKFSNTFIVDYSKVNLRNIFEPPVQRGVGLFVLPADRIGGFFNCPRCHRLNHRCFQQTL